MTPLLITVYGVYTGIHACRQQRFHCLRLDCLCKGTSTANLYGRHIRFALVSHLQFVFLGSGRFLDMGHSFGKGTPLCVLLKEKNEWELCLQDTDKLSKLMLGDF